MTELLAICALPQPVAVLYFAIFWTGFEVWRRHPIAIYSIMLGLLGGGVVAAIVWRDLLLGRAVALPAVVRAIGWTIVGTSLVFGTIADRQIGFRVRSFLPFFEERGRIELRTTGAYAIVRHPIYAAGASYQLGMFLVTGACAIAASAIVFGLGAVWFTRQEERHLRALLDDPAAYDRYRARVPALVPFLRGRSR